VDQPWNIEMLGGLCVRQADTVITRFKTHKNGALLGYLAYYLQRAHTRESLIETFWPDVDLEQGRPSLSVALSSLRHQLEPPGTPARSVLVTTNTEVRLNPAACATDVLEFERLVSAARKAGPGTEEIDLLTRAASCYKGELLFGYYDNWCTLERERLEGVYVQVLRSLVRGLVRDREIRKAVPYAEKAAAAAPLHEEVCRDLMQVYTAAGQPSLALEQYRSLEERLRRELGERPSASTRNLAREISERMQEEPPARATAKAPTAFNTASLAPAAAAPLPGIQTMLAVQHAALSEEQKEILRREARTNGGQELVGRAEFWLALFVRAADAAECALSVCKSIAESGAKPGSGTHIALHTIEADREASVTEAKQYLKSMLNASHPEQILCSEEASVFLRRSPGLSIRLRDLGRWRLQDAQAPTLLFDLQRQGDPSRDFPSPKAPSANRPALPMQFSKFIGRENELARLQALFCGEHPARLVTLTGPGGVGKTRLAVEAGHILADEWLGAVCFVPLAPVQEAERIAESILDALKQPHSSGVSPMSQLCACLNEHRTLLILDNLEQVAEGAAPILASLLEGAPGFSCLATSRRLLNVCAEQELQLLPLPIPTSQIKPDRPINCESVRLFVDRAQAARPDFQVTPHNAAAIAELCTKLEGLPLALELAAARAMVLTPSQMIAQLDDRFAFLTSRRKDVAERQRTLRGAVEWSYRLLGTELQQFFSRLSVFHDGWTLAAAESVCGTHETLDALCELQECSLLTTEVSTVNGGLRFRMLQSLQAFGDEQLEARDREVLREKHAIAFASLAEQGATHLHDDTRAEWLERLEQDHENLRTALTYFVEVDRVADAARMCADLCEFWERRGWLREGAAFIDLCLTVPQQVKDRVLLRRLLSSAGWFAYLQARYSEAMEWQQRNLAECSQANDAEGECIVLNNLGLIAQAQGRDEDAWCHFEASLSIARYQGNRVRQAARLSNMGLLAIQMDRNMEAQQALEEALSIYRADGDSYGIAACLCNLGKLSIYQERYTDALALAGESMRLFDEARDRSGVAYALANLSLAKTLSADHEGAAPDLLKALSICREIGLRSLVPVLLETLARNDLARARSPSAAFALAAAERLRKELTAPRSAFEAASVAFIEARLRSAQTTAEIFAQRAHAVALTMDQILAEILKPTLGGLP
jgi:predicted ATPase/DNA-binding SARP family transcriptional activator